MRRKQSRPSRRFLYLQRLSDKTQERLHELKAAYLEKRLWPNPSALSSFLFGFTRSPRPTPDEQIDSWKAECELLDRDDYNLSAGIDARCEVGGGEFPTPEKALGISWALRPELMDAEGELIRKAVWEALAQRRPLLR